MTFALLVLFGVPVLAQDPPPKGDKILDVERTVTLESGEAKALLPDAPEKDQRLTVTVRPKGSPVDVYLIPEKDYDKALEGLAGAERPKAFFAAFPAVEDELTFTVTVKAGTKVVLLYGNCKAKSELLVKLAGVPKPAEKMPDKK